MNTLPMNKAQQGFTLIELMIVVAIIGILAAVAIPAYGDYTSKTRAAGAAAELASTKTAVSVCYNDLLTFTGCDAGAQGVPKMAAATKNITAVPTVVAGVIKATTGATLAGTATALTIIDTPTFTAGDANIIWTNTGTSCDPIRGFKPGQGDCP